VRTIGAALALLASLAVAGVSIALNRGAPVVDAFYAAPSQIPAEPGTLLRAEPMARALPPNAQAWRILYTTTRVDGSATVGSGIVVAPANLPDEPQPVIAWAHGTTGVEQTCAPSVLRDPFKAGATPALDQVVANGWVMVAADYIGLGTEGPHAYLIGAEGGRAVLDAVRAARQLPGLTLSEQTVVWGHSQGGGVALWTGILAPSYAPDANVIGVAALAPASDLLGLVSNLDVVPGGAIFVSYIIAGYSATYPDVRFDDYIRPTARILVREMASRCLSEPAALTSVIESLVIDGSVWATNPQLGALGARLSENTPTAEISVPLLIGQGLADPLVLPTVQAAYVEARCAAGGMVDYRTYEGFEHVSVVEEGSPLIPELLAWTQERLDGRPAASTC
jgi:alpha-beta hydrolase superfamily lysophospholipase